MSTANVRCATYSRRRPSSPGLPRCPPRSRHSCPRSPSSSSCGAHTAPPSTPAPRARARRSAGTRRRWSAATGRRSRPSPSAGRAAAAAPAASAASWPPCARHAVASRPVPRPRRRSSRRRRRRPSPRACCAGRCWQGACRRRGSWWSWWWSCLCSLRRCWGRVVVWLSGSRALEPSSGSPGVGGWAGSAGLSQW